MRTKRSCWSAFAIEGAAWLAGLMAAAVPGSPALQAEESGRAPAILQVADNAKPIESANRHAPIARPKSVIKQTSAEWVEESSPAVNSPATEWKLRWRTPSVPQPIAAEPKPLAVSRAVSWDSTNRSKAFNRSPVRTVAQQTPVDPFEEAAPVQAPNVQDRTQPVPGTQRDANQNRSTIPNRTPPELNDPFSDAPARPAPAETAPAEPAKPMPSDLPFPQEPAKPAPMPERDLAPVPPSGIGPDAPLGPPRDVPCERTYNDRNCCADDAKCLLAQRFVAQYKINHILLDITPGFTNTDNISNADYVPTDVKRDQELAKSPTRSWKDRSGKTLAEGRFTDYHNGLIHVLGADGQTAKLPFNTLSNDDVCFVTAWWSLPTECSLADETFKQRDWIASTLTWKASALCHKPLYFEEVALERYGHSVGPIKQPFVSGAHFFGSLIALPYQMGIHPPQECQYALGYYRPGSCAPWLVPPFPVSLRGALAEAGVWVGGIFIIP